MRRTPDEEARRWLAQARADLDEDSGRAIALARLVVEAVLARFPGADRESE